MKKLLFSIIILFALPLLTACGQNNSGVAGDWEYQGLIGTDIYDVTLDLENDGQFELSIDNESNDTLGESDLKGTYVSDASTITLSVQTVEDSNNYYQGTAVNNEQLTLNYTIDNNTMTITNASSIVSFFPAELSLKRD